MSVPVAGCLLDFYVFAKFGALVGTSFDCGPGTPYPIRYSLADYKKMLRRHARDFLQGGTWAGPINFASTLIWHGQTGHVSASGPGSVASDDPFAFRVGATLDNIIGEIGEFANYNECPIIGDGPDRETATLSTLVSAQWAVDISLFAPRIEGAWWDNTATVWLNFSISNPEASALTSYICTPSGNQGGAPSDPIPSSIFLGIDFAGSGAFPTATQSYLLGDGTTEAFFEDDPAATDFLVVTQLDTRVGL